MAQKIIVVINAEAGDSLSVEGVKYDLEQQGYDVELIEDTLQKTSHPFQPLAYALQDDVSIALENHGYEATNKLIDVASRNLTGSEDLQEHISNEAVNIVAEGFEDEDLEEDMEEDDERDNDEPDNPFD